MARRCEICEKGITTGHTVSHSNKHTKRRWKPNLQRVKILKDGRPVKAYVCTACIRSGKVTKAV